MQRKTLKPIVKESLKPDGYQGILVAIDLHTHTVASDGTDSPEQLIDLAVMAGLSVIGITDHDTVSGLKRALDYGKAQKIIVVPGVELSIDYELPGDGHLHLLGLFIDYHHLDLNKALQSLRNDRETRMKKILACLEKLGMPFLYEEVKNEAGGGSLGRPHVAALLIKNGYVETMQQAFNLYLKKGAPAYIPKQKLPFEQAVNLIHISGGITVLAHPFSLGFTTYDDLKNEIGRLQENGLDGVEVYYPGYSASMQHWLLDLAGEKKLAISGGSDFHGTRKPETRLGQINNDTISFKVYQDLYDFRKELS